MFSLVGIAFEYSIGKCLDVLLQLGGCAPPDANPLGTVQICIEGNPTLLNCVTLSPQILFLM